MLAPNFMISERAFIRQYIICCKIQTMRSALKILQFFGSMQLIDILAKLFVDEDSSTSGDGPKDEAEPVTNGVEHQSGDKVKKEDADEDMPSEEEQRKQEEEKKPKEISPELAQRADQLLQKREELKEGNVKTAASVALSAAAVKAKVCEGS